MTAIRTEIFTAKQYSCKLWPHHLVTAVPAVLVVIINWILWTLGKTASCQLFMTKVNGEASRKWQVPGPQAGKWLLPGGEGTKGHGHAGEGAQGCEGESGTVQKGVHERSCVSWGCVRGCTSAEGQGRMPQWGRLTSMTCNLEFQKNVTPIDFLGEISREDCKCWLCNQRVLVNQL